MNRAAIYCRLSEEDEEKEGWEESESIRNQRSLLTDYAFRQGWEVAGIYCDEDYSGMDACRPDFNRLLADAEAGRFDIVLCKSQSRFTRDMEMVEKYIHGRFPEWGIRFVTAVDHVDTALRGGKKARQINGLINEWYLEDLSENVRAVLDDKRRKGAFIGSFAPYGYRKDPSDHSRLIVDEEAAEVVRRIFALRLQGRGCVAIAKQLNRENVPNPTDYKMAGGQPCKPLPESPSRHLWKDYTIREILGREAYTGRMVQGFRRKISYKSKAVRTVPEGERFYAENTHPPIVSRETFEEAARLARESAHPSGKQGCPHPLAGRVFCGICGSPLHLCRAKGHAYLRCRKSYRYGGGCVLPGIRYDRVEEKLLGALQNYFERWYDPGEVGKLIGERGVSPGERACRERQSLEAGLSRILRVQRALYADKACGEIDPGEYERLNRGYEEDRQKILTRIASLAGQENLAAVSKEERLRRYCFPRILDRNLAARMIERVEAVPQGEGDCGPERWRLRVYWRF